METFTLTNAAGMEVRFIAYEGIIVSIRVPDRDGRLEDVAAGYDTLEEYQRDGAFFGALVGRYTNRIGGARFELDGVEHALVPNDGPNQLHGGPLGFYKRTWSVESVTGTSAVLRYTSPAGEQGFPGTLHASVTYTLSDDNAFTMDYSAVTDAPTPVSLTQHTYFNLGGQAAGTVLGHELFINADRFTPIDAALIPTGEIRSVGGTPFDFTTPRPIGDALADDDDQLRMGGGFDHNFVLRPGVPGELTLAARVVEPDSGRTLEILTTEPGLQLYSGNGMHNGPPGKGGLAHSQYAAFALETQHFPDSPNQPAFPSTILRPGEGYESRTVWRFSTASEAG